MSNVTASKSGKKNGPTGKDRRAGGRGVSRSRTANASDVGTVKGVFRVKSAVIGERVTATCYGSKQPASDYSKEEIEWMHSIARSAAKGLAEQE